MSLTREAVRLATVRALQGKTMAAQVLDSEIGSPEEIAASATTAAPIILVYTDDGKGDENVSSLQHDLNAWEGSQTLFIEVIVTQRMLVKDDEGEAAIEIRQMPTDRRLELMVAMIEKEIKNALMDPTNEWSEIWRGFINGILSVSSQRATWQREGGRIAGRQLDLQLNLKRDPGFKADLDAHVAWSPFLAKLEASDAAAFVELSATFRSLLAGSSSGWSDYNQMLASLGGQRTWMAAALGDATSLTGDDPPPPIAEVEIDGNS